MDDDDLGVVVCVTSLVMALAQDHLEAYAVCYTKAVDRLQRVLSSVLYVMVHTDRRDKLVIEHEYAATYAYYKVPSPWLQVKLLRMLQYYPPSGRYPSVLYLFIFETESFVRGSRNSLRAASGSADSHEQ